MASKLFRAVVGFGIGLGATTAACFGATTDVDPPADGGPSQEGETSTTVPDVPPIDEKVDPTPDATVLPADAGADVAKDVAVDVKADAPKDAGIDAFCDAAWPTTKGNPGPPKCIDPGSECTDAGPVLRCYPRTDAGQCQFWNRHAGLCIDGVWQCPSGTEPTCP